VIARSRTLNERRPGEGGDLRLRSRLNRWRARGEIHLGEQLPGRLDDLGKHGSQALRSVGIDGLVRKKSGILHDSAGTVTATEINRESLHIHASRTLRSYTK